MQPNFLVSVMYFINTHLNDNIDNKKRKNTALSFFITDC